MNASRSRIRPVPERASGRRRYDEDVLRRLAIIDVVQRAGFTLEEIRELTGPDARGPFATARIRALADRKLADVDALIARAQAVRAWLQLARTCDCETVDVCGLFTDPVLAPPPVRRPHTAA
jgi:MerR family transcriptional regulator, redox-sensitive transcriptional activator SoxR